MAPPPGIARYQINRGVAQKKYNFFIASARLQFEVIAKFIITSAPAVPPPPAWLTQILK
jgi:hypothetical protein